MSLSYVCRAYKAFKIKTNGLVREIGDFLFFDVFGLRAIVNIIKAKNKKKEEEIEGILKKSYRVEEKKNILIGGRKENIFLYFLIDSNSLFCRGYYNISRIKGKIFCLFRSFYDRKSMKD